MPATSVPPIVRDALFCPGCEEEISLGLGDQQRASIHRFGSPHVHHLGAGGSRHLQGGGWHSVRLADFHLIRSLTVQLRQQLGYASERRRGLLLMV